MKYNLGWGNSVCIRQAFLSVYNQNPVAFAKEELLKFDYPAHEGDSDLIKITKEVIKRQTGQSYNYVFLTNGANGAVTIALRAYAKQGYEMCLTRKAPYYTLYPQMIESAGLTHIYDAHDLEQYTVCLLDLPSNPSSLLDTITDKNIPVILDGVYLNNVYTSIFINPPKHDVMIGSYSKLTGINGIRLGWIATNNPLLAERIYSLITSEYSGLSVASTEVLKHVLQGLNWDLFEKVARSNLDHNRGEWSKLEKFFDGTPVNDIGMFYYSSMDNKAQQLFKKADITWMEGSKMGTSDDFARFNLGQDCELISKVVEEVLKKDKRTKK